MTESKTSRVGFTLIELLVVISIIGILSSLATVSVNVARVKARNAVRQSDVSQVRLALYMYYDDNLAYPVTGGILPEEVTVENWNNILTPALSGVTTGQVYIARPPIDPLNKDLTVYKYASNGQEFVIDYYLEKEGQKELHEY